MLDHSPRLRLPEEADVIVIGGGISGVAIARECALAGRRVLLVEKDDFCSGTTSRTTRIVHGGLRYVEYGEFGMVREALHERERLLRERPHLVRPMKFVFALNESSRHSALELRFGLWLYRRLAGKRGVRTAPKVDLAELERQLDNKKRWALFEYDDAQCEFPERLVAEWLTEAVDAGAAAHNYTEALEISSRDGRVRGAVLRDRMTGSEQHVRSEWVINATGPWVERVFRSTGLATANRPMLSPTRGTHIVLPRPGTLPTPIYTEAGDGRPVFLIPWNGALLVGATEVPDVDCPDKVAATPSEVMYLLTFVNKLLPSVCYNSSDIHYTFAGVRPLAYAADAALGTASRRHVIRNHAADGALGLYSVIGGKLTTAAAVARRCARMIGVTHRDDAPVMTAPSDLRDVENTFATWARMVSAAASIPESCARSLASWHGTRALTIAYAARQDAALRAPLHDNCCHIVAEAVEAVNHECAVTLADILLRRVPVGLSPDFTDENARTAANRIGAALGWTESRTGSSVESFLEERAAFLRKPTLLTAAPAEHAA